MEALCKLMTTVGKKLDVAKAREHMNAYFSRTQEIIQHSNLPARIKFMLEDLVELRKRNWIPRHAPNAPKTIKEVHKEAAEMEKEKEKDLRNMRNDPPNYNVDTLFEPSSEDPTTIYTETERISVG
jgi:translation initiation factor 4G